VKPNDLAPRFASSGARYAIADNFAKRSDLSLTDLDVIDDILTSVVIVITIYI
jgi:hypothetical protein